MTTGNFFAFAGAAVFLLAPVSFAQTTPAPNDDSPTLSIISEAANGLTSNEKNTLFIKAFSWTAKPETLEVRVRGIDWNGNEAFKSTVPIEFKGNSSVAVPVSLPKYGPVEITAQLWRPNEAKPLREEKTRLVRPAPVAKLDGAAREKSYIGVNTHYNAPWESLAKIGVHWARDYSWGWLGGEKSVPPMAGNNINFAPTVRKAESAGVTILPILSRAWYNEEKTGWISDTARIANAYEALGKAFPGIARWEVDNEPEYGFVTHNINLENYRPYLKAASDGLKRAGNARVVLAGTAGMKVGDTKKLLRADAPNAVRDEFAVVNYHYYTGGGPLETAHVDTNASATDNSGGAILDVQRELNQIAHAAGKEAWLTEVGWDVEYGFAVGERLQAIYLARAYLLSRANGTDKVFWYFDRDAKGTGKYSSCGLFDRQSIARASAAALAALSQQTALATPAGTLDLGKGIWSVVLSKPSGGFVVTAWTLEGRAPLPDALKNATAFDLFGNAVKPNELSPEVTYFHLDTLPAAWEGSRRVALISPHSNAVAAGQSVPIEVSAPAGASVKWDALPQGVQGDAWQKQGGVEYSTLQLAPGVEPQILQVAAIAAGGNWSRRIPLEIEVRPAATVKIGAYLPGEPLAGELSVPIAQTATLSSAGATLQPAKGEVSADAPLAFSITPPASARGPLPLSIALSGGARQTEMLRPRLIDVPRATSSKLGDQWNQIAEKFRLSSQFFVSSERDFAPQAAFAWSPEGLIISARIPAAAATPTNPESFWDWTNLELFVDTDAKGKSWGPTARQFYFVPREKDGAWSLVAGEFRRTANLAKTTFDDARIPTFLRREGNVLWLEALIPAAVLGAAPLPGTDWRAVLATRRVSLSEARADAVWPVNKSEGLLDGRNWGVLRFAP